MAKASKGRRSPPTVPLREHGFRGMQATTVEDAETEGFVPYLLNLWPTRPDEGGPLMPRPKLNRLATNSGVGTSTSRLVTFSSAVLNDTTYQVSANGIDRLGSGTLTNIVSASDLASASITVSTTGTIWCMPFNQHLIVSDGVHAPWMWDGTAGGGLTSLTNCPALYGPPTVYFAKLFGIKASDRTTIVWSEENDPATGYEAAGYNNAWTLTQTDSDPLVRVVGTNDGLYYWRHDSIGVIRGAVASDFRTTGTHDDLSTGVGATGPGAVTEGENTLWFLDRQQRPHVIRDGQVLNLAAKLDPYSNGAQQYDPWGLGDFSWYNSWGIGAEVHAVGPMLRYRRATVWFGMRRRVGSGGEYGALWLVYDQATQMALGWVLLPTAVSGDAFRGMAGILDSGGSPCLGLVGASGSVFLLGGGSGANVAFAADDAEAGLNASTPVYRVIGRALAHDDAVEVAGLRWDATVDVRTGQALDPTTLAATLQLLTPAAPTTALATSQSLTFTGPTYAEGMVTEMKTTVGLNPVTTLGRTLRVHVAPTVSGSSTVFDDIRLQGWTLWVTPTTTTPYAP